MPAEYIPSNLERAPKKERTERVEIIPISLLRQSRYQVRDEAFESRSALKDLAESIKAMGLLELPRVRKCSDDPECYELISGHRRVRAVSEHLGWKEIKCIVCEEVDEVTAFSLGAAENIHRNNLSPYEEGIAYLLCHKLFGFSDDQLMELFNRSKAIITSRREIATAANEYLRFVTDFERDRFLQNFTLGHRDILRELQDKEAIACTVKMVARGASVRNLRRYVDFMRYTSSSKSIESRQLSRDYFSNDALRTALETVDELRKEVPRPLREKVSKLAKSLTKLNTLFEMKRSSQQVLDTHGLINGESVSRKDLLSFLYDTPIGTHLVLLYEDPSFGEVFSLLFLLQGLLKGETAVYVTQEDEEEARKSMAQHGVDINYYEKERSLLHVRKVTDPFQHSKGFNEGMREMYRKIFQGVKRPCRVVGSSIPVVDTERRRKATIKLESSVHSAFEGKPTDLGPYTVFRNFEGSIMCRYRIERTGPTPYVKWIKNIVSNHHASVFLAEHEEKPILLNLHG